MTGPGEDDPLLANIGHQNRSGRPSVGNAVLRLYRNDPVWRGAVDLVVIGTLMMFLMGQFPDAFSGVKNLMNNIRPTPQTSSSSGNTGGTQMSAANFKPLNDTSKNSTPMGNPLPTVGTPFDLEWETWISGKLSAEEKDLFRRAALMRTIDYQKAIDLIKDKAEKGDPDFEFLTGIINYYRGDKDRDPTYIEKAIYWYKESASAGNPQAQYELGQMYRIGTWGITVDVNESIKWYEMAAANPVSHDGKAENELGRLYERGFNGHSDYSKTLDYYRRGAEKGNFWAEGNYGVLLYNSHNSADRDKAVFWVKKAASDGNAQSQMNLARISLTGGLTGGNPDYPSYLKWEGAAADQGFTDAFIDLGDFYREGRPGYPIDNMKAARYYRLAALKKHPKAQYMLAMMFERGLGVPQDNIQAYVYYTLAYEGGYTPAVASLDALKARMSPGDLDHAEKMTKAIAEGASQPGPPPSPFAGPFVRPSTTTRPWDVPYYGGRPPH